MGIRTVTIILLLVLVVVPHVFLVEQVEVVVLLKKMLVELVIRDQVPVVPVATATTVTVLDLVGQVILMVVEYMAIVIRIVVLVVY